MPNETNGTGTECQPCHPALCGCDALCAGTCFAQFERQGAEMHTLDPGPLAEYAAITRGILLSEAYAIHEHWLQERPQDYGALMRERVLVGAFFRAVDYVQATRQRAVLAQQFARCLDTVDVAITASSMDPACPVEDAERCEYTYNRQARAPFNLTGSPALAVPTGFASTGFHSRGIKVRLQTGAVGRVQEIVETSHTEVGDA